MRTGRIEAERDALRPSMMPLFFRLFIYFLLLSALSDPVSSTVHVGSNVAPDAFDAEPRKLEQAAEAGLATEDDLCLHRAGSKDCAPNLSPLMSWVACRIVAR